MPFQKNNKLGGGKKGKSGRKPARIEFEGLKDLEKIMEGGDEMTIEKVKERISSGKYGAKHRLALRAMEEGNVQLLSKLMDKLYANKQHTEHTGQVDSVLTINILDK